MSVSDGPRETWDPHMSDEGNLASALAFLIVQYRSDVDDSSPALRRAENVLERFYVQVRRRQDDARWTH